MYLFALILDNQHFCLNSYIFCIFYSFLHIKAFHEGTSYEHFFLKDVFKINMSFIHLFRAFIFCQSPVKINYNNTSILELCKLFGRNFVNIFFSYLIFSIFGDG